MIFSLIEKSLDFAVLSLDYPRLRADRVIKQLLNVAIFWRLTYLYYGR
jgi:hypothetical protein